MFFLLQRQGLYCNILQFFSEKKKKRLDPYQQKDRNHLSDSKWQTQPPTFRARLKCMFGKKLFVPY